jgi:2-C-methyl-D-erythritol 2,4-cyclodiphosphate synthase
LNQQFRSGFGFDVHAFAENRKLILGGIEIPHVKGLLGHSDADALLHSITDAMLGALALGDIGQHFPDTNPEFKNADSSLFLRQTYKMVKEKGYLLGNIDSMISLQEPKIAKYIFKMRENISAILNVELDQVSVKAGTNEKLGFVGREEGVAVFSTVLLIKINKV